MRHELNFWVVGGDPRQWKLAQLLAEEGHTVHTLALEQPGEPEVPGLLPQPSFQRIDRADCVVLPLSVTGADGLIHAPLSPARLPLEAVLDALSPGQFLCGGQIDDSVRNMARQRGLTVHDYFAREELAVANAVPTAEGALQLAMERLPITIHGARVLVIGFGRVGRLTAQRFQALGARVSVAARRFEHLAWAQALGFQPEPLDQLEEALPPCDLVVNTVPAPVLGRVELSLLKTDCLVLDLASKPGGVDQQAAAALGLEAVHALALPGKVAPVTAGAILRDTICNMLREAGFLSRRASG